MTQPGYGYPMPDGYGRHQSSAEFSSDSHRVPLNLSATTSSETPYSSIQGHAPNYGHNKIPGLGLGQPSTSISDQSSWPSGQAGGWSQGFRGSQTSSQTKDILNGHVPTNRPRPGTRGADSEDGEVSEDGEFEDVYEPMDTETDTVSRRVSMRWDDSGPTTVDYRPQSIREHSGSYSPYLSPREISPVGTEPVRPKTDPPLAPNVAASHLLSDENSHPPSLASAENRHVSRSELEMAYKQAKDAILHLWPLNIGFQNYITEGVDETLLKSMFKDLGLSLTVAKNTTEAGGMQQSKKSTGAPMLKAINTDANPSKKSSSIVCDKSEERKDRIARLLAAKGSKQTSATASTPKAPVSAKAGSPATMSNKAPLTQSEKSKLLQQKMEALKRAREALKQRKPIQLEEGDSSKDDSTPEAFQSHNGAVKNPSIDEGEASIDFKGSQLHNREPTQVLEPSHQVEIAKIPDSQHPRLTAPFDQNLESRPFLITVSDDDDDEDMEIDSDSPKGTPLRSHSNTSQRQALTHDTASLSDSALIQQVRSSAGVSTSLRNLSRNNGGDLESMNKKIEDMKRRIAEAEARKKAKSSRQASPTSSSRNDDSLANSPEVAGHPAAASATTQHRDLGKEAATSLASNMKHRSHSRIASERLPLLEAKRREQLVKLKALQSEVARIEKQLEEDMLEEERLKGEMISYDSNEDDVRSTYDDAVSETSLPIPLVQEATVCSEQVKDNGPYTETANENGIMISTHVQESEGQDRSLLDGPAIVSMSQAAGDVSDPGVANQSFDTSIPEVDTPLTEGAHDGPSGSAAADDSHEDKEDIAMRDAGELADENAGIDSSDDYEPLEAGFAADADIDIDFATDDPVEKGNAPPSLQENISLANKGTSFAHQSGQQETTDSRQVESAAPSSSFVPYESPLQYFHAYRFHPLFNRTVSGGLRSLTYSNKIDLKMEVCPNQLAGLLCPTGFHCDYQHFESMQAPDDQILLQLGAADHYSEQQRQEYIAGLRQLLTDYRNRKVKDFQTISQGIIDYRVAFLGDKSKILPLGNVAL